MLAQNDELWKMLVHKVKSDKTIAFMLPSIIVAIIFFFTALNSYDGAKFFGGMLTLISTYLFAIFCFFKIISQYLRKNYRTSVSYVLGLLTLVLAFGFPNNYFLNAAIFGNYLKVTVNEDSYLIKVNKLNPDIEGHRYLEIKDDSLNPFIVYDDSDKILQYDNTDRHNNIKQCIAIVRKLKLHFYYVVTNDEVC